MSVSSQEMAKRIATATQRRNTDKRRQMELWRELRDEMAQQRDARQLRSATHYLPSILLFLLFLSFPLSEQTVDWLVVACFVVLNACCAALASQPAAWMHLAVVTMCNVVLACWSHLLRDVPRLLATVPAPVYAAYTVGNACLVLLLYTAYVDRGLQRGRRVLQRWRSGSDHNSSSNNNIGGGGGSVAATTRMTAGDGSHAVCAAGEDRGRGASAAAAAVATGTMTSTGAGGGAVTGSKRAHSGSSGDDGGDGGARGMPSLQVLERYVAERAYAERLDLALTICVVVNVATLIYLDVIPYTMLLRGARNLLGLAR